MSALKALGWVIGLWVAAGVEAAWHGGLPGPMLLVALAAGLLVSPTAGMILGVLAGVGETALFGGPVLLNGTLGLLCGLAGGVIARWCAPRNLFVGVGAALLLSFPATLLVSWSSYSLLSDAALMALRRSGENALWMTAIYGIVLLLSHRITPARFGE